MSLAWCFVLIIQANETVSDYMTGGAVYTCKADDSVDDGGWPLVNYRSNCAARPQRAVLSQTACSSHDTYMPAALELLVTHRITGLPVVDENKKVVSMLLAADQGRLKQRSALDVSSLVLWTCCCDHSCGHSGTSGTRAM